MTFTSQKDSKQCYQYQQTKRRLVLYTIEPQVMRFKMRGGSVRVHLSAQFVLLFYYLLRKMIKKRNMKLVNATNKCTGTWTRVNTGNKDQKSILDYVITSEKMEEKVKTRQIDEDGLYITTRYKAETTVETDHRPIIIIDNNEQSEEEKEGDKDTVKWNFRKETEVNRYKEETAESD